MAERSSAEASFYALIGRALVDETYRNRIINDKTQAQALAESLGRQPTSEDLAALRASISALLQLHGRFGPGPFSA